MEAESTAETEIIEAVEPVLKEPETKISDEEREKEQDVLIIAQVNDYVNIRSTASTDGEIVGKLYNNSVGTLVAKGFTLVSGKIRQRRRLCEGGVFQDRRRGGKDRR